MSRGFPLVMKVIFYSMSIALCYSLKTVERFDELFEEDIVPTFINEVLFITLKLKRKKHWRIVQKELLNGETCCLVKR